MTKQKLLLAILTWTLCLPVLAEDNPFAKKVSVDIGSDSEWVIKDKTATRSGSSAGLFYHLFYDRKQLRLRITAGAEDSEASAKKYPNFAVEDMQIDGKRLAVFQWCLSHQQKHARFLQQGLKVKQDVCKNQGNKGAFTTRLNAATLASLKNGGTLSFTLKPFRSSMVVNFDISDFADVVSKLNTKVKVVKKSQEPAVIEKVQVKKCNAMPPKGFEKIESVEYICDDSIAKSWAESSVEAAVEKEQTHKAELAAERERKRKAAAAKKAETLALKKAADDKAAAEAVAKAAAEAAILAETEAAKKVINADITNKMLGVCQKKWARGEHRCYCEEFLEHAPENIASDPSCATN